MGKILIIDVRDDTDYVMYLFEKDEFSKMFKIYENKFVGLKDSYLESIDENLDIDDVYDIKIKEFNEKNLVCFENWEPTVVEKTFIWNDEY